MQGEPANDRYFIWGIDESAYGPVDHATLINWIKDERVLPDTWVFKRSNSSWTPARDLAEIKMFFSRVTKTGTGDVSPAKLSPGALRRIKILSALDDVQLAHLSDFIEKQNVKQWSVVVRQGEIGDAMFFVLEGELRARTMVGERETILSTFGVGEVFGDMALFDHGPRSADVVANVDSTVVKLSAAQFNRLIKEAPSLAAPFLQASVKTLAARIRADNKRLDRVTQQFSASSR
ncbi:MAG: cyclic nucleotide-binding domain-containing protein [Verrucomicrobiota bacterium]